MKKVKREKRNHIQRVSLQIKVTKNDCFYDSLLRREAMTSVPSFDKF